MALPVTILGLMDQKCQTASKNSKQADGCWSGITQMSNGNVAMVYV